jgi:lipoprotein-releasing system permease protein
VIESAIARRYLWAARKERHMAFLSTISIAGLALGVAALLISIALLSGLQGHIKEQLIASSPQLLIEPIGRNTIDDAVAIAAEAKRNGMKTVHPVVSGIGWGANDEERRGRPLRIRSYERGGEPAPDRMVRRSSRPFDPNEPSIFVTRDTASALGLDLGDFVTIVAPRTRLTPFGPVPVWKKFRIARLVTATGDDRGAEAYLEMSEAERLFGTGGKPTSIEMYGSAERAEEIQPQIAARFPGVQVKTWKEINRPLFLALRLEKIVMFATISLIIFVAALNLVSSMAMLVLEKRPSVGVLRTLGATNRTIMSVFMQVGLFIGITGTVIGNIIGLGVSFLADRYHLIPLPSGAYFLRTLPFRIDPMDVIGVNVIAIVLSIVATWYPARVASRLDPIAAIREE